MVYKKRKSVLWTYICWLFGGLFGLHHFYLNRDRHAFAFIISFGGYFGTGWIRDLWRIPEYVAEINEDPAYVEILLNKMRQQRKPSFGIIRYFAGIIVADIMGYLIMGAIPHELWSEDGATDNPISRTLIAILVPFGCALGVHIVGNVGRYSGSILQPLIGAYLTAPFYFRDQSPVFITSLIALIVFVRFSMKWRRTPLYSPRTTADCSILLLCLILYSSLWVSWFYFSCSVTDKNEETIKCRDALQNFLNSPAWREFRDVLYKLYLFIQTEGIGGLWKEIVDALDPKGENNALKVLGLSEKEATQEAISTRYRQLARQWHPDKHHLAEKKKIAQERFMEIQEAYDVLRNRKPMKSRESSN